MRRVILESPYAGDVEENTRYAQLCVADALNRGDAPIASHLLYTQPNILDDTLVEERNKGIDVGLSWAQVADATVVYTDRGITSGMKYGIKRAEYFSLPIEYRELENYMRPNIEAPNPNAPEDTKFLVPTVSPGDSFDPDRADERRRLNGNRDPAIRP